MLATLNGVPQHILKNRIHSSLAHPYITPFNHLNETEQEIALRTYFKFVFLRHPFERILSAFRDKLVDPRMESSWGGLRNRLKHMYRPSCQQKVTGCEAEPLKLGEFVQFLIDPRTSRPYDPHWRQVDELCQPCSIRFDFIGHFETFVEDRMYVMRRLGIDKLVQFPSPLTHNTSDLVTKYFAEVPPADVERLRQIYRADFDLFGYQ
jgi:hypothetical protein